MIPIRKKFQELLKGRKVAGVEVMLDGGNVSAINLVVLERKKDTLNILKSEAVTDIETLAGTIDPELPVALMINGKGIICKKIEYQQDEDHRELINKVLPNASLDDFYMDVYPDSKNSAFVGLARRSVIDSLIEKIRKLSLYPIEISLGPFAVSGITSVIEKENEDKLIAGNFSFNISDGKITDFEHNEHTENSADFSIGTERIGNEFIPAFSVAFHYFVPEALSVIKNEQVLQEDKEEFNHKKLFSVGGKAVLVIFLAVLLVNFLVFDHYRSKSNELNNIVSMNEDRLLTIKQLEGQIDRKRKFLDKMGVLNSSQTSYYADRIAMSVPKDIQLTEMFINPLEKKRRRSEKEIEFIPGMVHITGDSEKSTYLNDWIKVLKEYEWVEDVRVIDYTQDSKRDRGQFEIEIKLNAG